MISLQPNANLPVTTAANSTAGTRTFAIKEIERLCGIKAHTIRTWELRYGVLQPSRRNTDRRHYTIEELEKALQLCLLNRKGFKISQLAPLSVPELSQKINGLFDVATQEAKAVHGLISCMYRLNVEGFENILDSCFVSLPLADAVEQVIYPFLQKVGLLFQGKRLTEEHLVVTLIRKKLLYAIEKTEARKTNGKKACLFLCGEHQLDLFLLFAFFKLKQQGYAVINLGADVTAKNLSEVVTMHQPEYLLTYCPKKLSRIDWLLHLAENEGRFAKLIVVTPERSEAQTASKKNLAEVYYEDVWQLSQHNNEKMLMPLGD